MREAGEQNVDLESATPMPPATASTAGELELRVRERTAELHTLLEWMRTEEAERRDAESAARRRAAQLERFEAALLRLVTTAHSDINSALRDATQALAGA